MWTDAVPRLRGGENTDDFHLPGWAGGWGGANLSGSAVCAAAHVVYWHLSCLLRGGIPIPDNCHSLQACWS